MADSQMRVLIVESPGSGDIDGLVSKSELAGSLLRRARDIEETLRVLGTQGFDVLLVDLALPDAHGLATVTRIREAAPDVPMIVFTDALDEPMALQAVQVGAQDYLVKAADGVAELERSLRYSLTAKGAEDSLSHLAQHDHLTGLPNRDLFDDRLDHAIVRALRHDSVLALLVIDIDGFAGVNAKYGPQIGDETLKAAAEKMRETLRRMDTLARSHSNTFLLIAEDVAELEGAEVVARKMLDALRAPLVVGEHRITVTMSIGIGLFPTGASDPEELLSVAGASMEAAKEAGGDGFRAGPAAS